MTFQHKSMVNGLFSKIIFRAWPFKTTNWDKFQASSMQWFFNFDEISDTMIQPNSDVNLGNYSKKAIDLTPKTRC